MTIGALAEQAGLRPSAIRYYERLGLLPAPHRRGGRRDYDPDAVAQLAVVQFARSAGFTLADTRQLVRGFSPAMAAGTRWRGLRACDTAWRDSNETGGSATGLSATDAWRGAAVGDATHIRPNRSIARV